MTVIENVESFSHQLRHKRFFPIFSRVHCIAMVGGGERRERVKDMMEINDNQKE